MKRRQHYNERRRFRKLRKAAELQVADCSAACDAKLAPAESRSGSVLVVVLVLMMGLLFLGMLLFTEASQEERSSEYYAAAGKSTKANFNPEPLFDIATRQLILGANNSEHQSPFYGGRHSFLTLMYGNDTAPFSGEGVHFGGYYTSGLPYVSRNHGTSPDSPKAWRGINQSPAAVESDRAIVGKPDSLEQFPAPDVGYVYPDHTNTFLHYKCKVTVANGTTHTILVPSFVRPALLEGSDKTTLYTDDKTKQLVMRAHREHVSVLPDGTPALDSAGKKIRRFISSVYPDTAGGIKPFTPDNGDPTAVPPIPPLNAFTGLRHGPWSGHETGSSDAAIRNDNLYDVDVDGDGVKDAVYLDLGLPMIEIDGVKVVPMVAMKIVDQDALMNVNGQGNIAKHREKDGNITKNPLLAVLTEYLSSSHLAVSPSEVNPLYVTRGVPAPSDPDQYKNYFGRNPVGSIDLANMEWWWLLMGRPEYEISSTTVKQWLTGRWGELLRTQNNPKDGSVAYPAPGWVALDDNGNKSRGGASVGIHPFLPGVISSIPFRHPIDFHGRGNIDFTDPGRHAFPAYHKYQINTPSYPTSLLTGSQNSPLVNEPAETLLWAELATNQNSDAIFGPADTLALHLNKADRISTGMISNRLLKLMPSITAHIPTARKLTAHSWGLKSFSWPRYTRGPRRDWEFVDSGTLFPPVVPSSSPGEKRFRPEIIRLLNHQVGDRTTQRLLRRLSLNGLVEQDKNGRLRIRPLTPHPPSIAKFAKTVISDTPKIISLEEMTPNAQQDTLNAQQEWLARYDRQRLCRDIYTLLYLFGGGKDQDYRADNSTGALYNDVQLREMAQLAVNWVDALDPDDVITKFEYGKDLQNSKGWLLDDDPFTDDTFTPLTSTDTDYNPNYPEDSKERGVVYGVEAQKLCFNEALAVFAKKIVDSNGAAYDHPATQHKEDDQDDHHFAYIELHNVFPTEIDLSKGNWQIVIKKTMAKDGTTVLIEERRLQLNDQEVLAPDGDFDKTIFAIATGSDTKTGSKFRVDPKAGANIQKLIPAGKNDLDLLGDDTKHLYLLFKGSDKLHDDGALVQDNSTKRAGEDFLAIQSPNQLSAQDQTTKITVQLRRRMNLQREAPTPQDQNSDHIEESKDNPWVVVDEIQMPLRVFELKEGDGETEITKALEELKSFERFQPFSNLGEKFPGTPTNFKFNSIGKQNDASGDPNDPTKKVFTLWQRHYDRDFTSITELFALPLYAPHELTAKLGTIASVDKTTPSELDFETIADNRFLAPTVSVGEVGPDGNRWHRILELFEVPEANPQPLRNPPTRTLAINLGRNNKPIYPRTPAKVNLNTLRHAGALAGLLDDSRFTFNSGNQTLMDGADDWWLRFLQSRDGLTNGLPLPGVPGVSKSKPFRGLSYHLKGDTSLEHTALRHEPRGSGRFLFEPSTGVTDHTDRHRFLSKVVNNTTNRSNVFVVHMQIDFFQAKEVDAVDQAGKKYKVVRIGAISPDSPGYRKVYLIDRSKAAKANVLKSHHFPAAKNGRFSWSFNQEFDYSPLILHQQRIK